MKLQHYIFCSALVAGLSLGITESPFAAESENKSPGELKFQAVDGKEVDLVAFRGKVILLDFWATWCGPCVGEVPHVVEAYKKYHDKGFEIVGISLDTDKKALNDFIRKHDMAWPQYFDGKKWKNKIAVQFEIHSIPAMWLIDKEGNIVTKDARGNLSKLIEAQLAK